MEERDKDIINHIPKEDEIDLLDIAVVLWAKRIFLFKFTAFFAALGIFIAIFYKYVTFKLFSSIHLIMGP